MTVYEITPYKQEAIFDPAKNAPPTLCNSLCDVEEADHYVINGYKEEDYEKLKDGPGNASPHFHKEIVTAKDFIGFLGGIPLGEQAHFTLVTLPA